jgi:circadian clock protein KaiC
MGDITDRCPTGIIGFDKICQGGLVRNSTNVILGGPGSGKTTFLLQFLYNGSMNFNENGLYCSFEPDIIETLRDAMAFGWDFTKLNEQNKIKFLKFSPQTSIKDLKSEITKFITQYNVKRICFDPISVIGLNLSDEGKIRELIFELASLTKRLNVTTVFADESQENESMDSIELVSWSKTDIMRFLSDSVINFYDANWAGVGDRALRIVKMRRTAHHRKPVAMRITNQGMEVLP